MLNRIMQLSEEMDSSIFLFGGRQTGKTTILHQQFPNAIFFDLLDTSIKMRLLRRPSLLYETLRDKPAGTLVIIDEIPEVPETKCTASLWNARLYSFSVAPVPVS